MLLKQMEPHCLRDRLRMILHCTAQEKQWTKWSMLHQLPLLQTTTFCPSFWGENSVDADSWRSNQRWFETRCLLQRVANHISVSSPFAWYDCPRPFLSCSYWCSSTKNRWKNWSTPKNLSSIFLCRSKNVPCVGHPTGFRIHGCCNHPSMRASEVNQLLKLWNPIVLQEQTGRQKFNSYLLNCVYREPNIDGHYKWLCLFTDLI